MSQESTAAFLSARDFLLRHREDYLAACRGFQWPRFTSFNWAIDHFDAMAGDNNRLALWLTSPGGEETKITFAEMSRRSNRAANYLRGLGVARGDRILLMIGNDAPLWECMLAAMKLGAVIVPASTLLTPADLADRFARGKIRHVITTAEQAPKFQEMSGGYTRVLVDRPEPGWQFYREADGASDHFLPDAETKATDPLFLYFTSGTTAKPKLVLHTHQTYPVGHLSTMYWIGLRPGDVHLNISSPGWAKHAWSCVFAPWNAGATVFMFNQTRFNATQLLDALATHPVTTFCAPPTVWRMLVQEDLSKWRVRLAEAVSAGEPLNPEVIDTVRKSGSITIRDGYGQTETSAQIANSPGQEIRPGLMGRPLPGFDVRLVDADGVEQVEGEICLSHRAQPAGLMVGYMTDDGTVRGHATDYYRTGDIARRDPDGYLEYVGRADDVFKSSGYRISPFELESALIEHDAVAEAAVVPSPDPTRSTVPKAYITVSTGFSADRETALSIFRSLRKSLAPYKRVRRLEFAELPKTISGKIRRVELRQKEAAARAEDRRGQSEYWEEDFPELAVSREAAT